VAKKKTIRFEENFEGILYGLVSQLKDYRLCWYINKELNFDLMRMNDIEIIHKKKNKQQFSVCTAMKTILINAWCT